jgi:hypothetical protein
MITPVGIKVKVPTSTNRKQRMSMASEKQNLIDASGNYKLVSINTGQLLKKKGTGKLSVCIA